MHRLAIGKRQEFLIWARLLKENFDIFPSLVDDKGIDALVGHNGTYYEIQVKSAGNWTGQRGIDFTSLTKSIGRIYIIANHLVDDIRYFTSADILAEPAWSDKIKWGSLSQIPLSDSLLEKYSNHNWEGLISYLKGIHPNLALSPIQPD